MKKNNILKLIYYTIITLIFFGMLIKLNYATDTYQVFTWDGESVYAQFSSSGRFVTAIIGKIVKDAQISEQAIYTGSYFLAIVFTTLSQYKLYAIIKKDVKSKVLSLIIPTLIIINPFSIELFLYIENGIMIFGVLMCIYAIQNLIKFYEKKKIKYLIYSAILMFIANCSYQGVVGIFVSISLIYVLKYSKTIKQFIQNNFIVSLIYGIPAISNFIIIKILFKASRLNGKIELTQSLQKIFNSTHDMILKTYNILPENLFILAILFTFALFCSKIWKEQKKYLHIIKFLYIVIGTIFVAIIPQIIQPTESIWFVPRVTYCFASLYGVLLLYIAINFKLKNAEKAVVIIISSILIVFQITKFLEIEKDRYIVNQKDFEVTSKIIKQINEYEQKTGVFIKNIAIYNDESPNYTYKGIFATGDISVKCYANDWSIVAILNYYLQRNLQISQIDEKEAQRFSQKNWDEYNEEQIKFEENTIILCKY